MCSHAEGISNNAQNIAEHAEGKYNLSHKKTTGTAEEQAAGTTLSSVGCGTNVIDRKNAIEVMQNGDVYIKGVGGYDGTNPGLTYSNLARLLQIMCLMAESGDDVRGKLTQQSMIYDMEFGFVCTPIRDREMAEAVFNSYFRDHVEGQLSQAITYEDNVVFVGVAGGGTVDQNNEVFANGVCCLIEIGLHTYYFSLEL